MTKKTYLIWQKYFAAHAFARQVAGTLATRLAAVTVCLPVVLVWYPAGRLYIAWAGICLVAGWLCFVQLLARLFPAQRPYQQFGFVPSAGKGFFSHADAKPDAFPSGHTTALCILALCAAPFLSPWLTGAAVFLALSAGAARVLLGWHFFRDVVGALLLASGVVAGFYVLGLFDALRSFMV